MVIRHLFDEFFVCKVRGRDGFTQGGESVALVIRHKILRGSVHICAEDEVDKTDHHALQVDGLAHPSIEVLEPCWVEDRKSTRLNSSHVAISYAVFCLKKKQK